MTEPDPQQPTRTHARPATHPIQQRRKRVASASRRLLAPLYIGLLVGLLLAGPAAAGELKLATWNLSWLTLRPAGDPILPSDVVTRVPADFMALQRYALALDADVVAFQEVEGPQAAARVFPTDRYTIVMTDDHVVQRVGFAIRRGIRFERNADLRGLVTYPHARFALRSGIDVTLLLGGSRLRLLNVHLKTGCHYDRLTSRRRSCETLRKQVPTLTGWVAQRRAEGVPFVLMGDFNRQMDGPDDLLSAIEAGRPLLRATAGQATPCWGGNSFIDHIIAGGAARGWMEPKTLRVLVYREHDAAMKEHLSDHCPVSVKFDVPG